MSDKINGGGSAFPALYVEHMGMSLRDWFAGQALVGMGTWSPWETQAMHNKAHWAYDMADAMLAARDGSASV